MKTLKYRYVKLAKLNRDINDLDLLGEQAGVKDYEFIRQVKKDLVDKINAEKMSIAKSKSKIFSELKKSS